MKFGQTYQAALERDEYPPEWIENAISYKKLKKCIKRVQQELQGLGLDPETLKKLWQHIDRGRQDADNSASGRYLRYSLDKDEAASFSPKLTIAIDPRDGSPMDAWLSPATRRALRQFAQNLKDAGGQRDPETPSELESHEMETISDCTLPELSDNGSAEHIETVEVPLTSDSEFFQILRKELANLEKIQQSEQERLQSEITRLGRDLRDLKTSKSKRSKAEIQAWREIFKQYNDAQVFLSSHEQDAGARDAAKAQQQLQLFTTSLSADQGRLKLGREANAALEDFMHINMNLLRLMKFQEINRTALTKIMKKFDKRTALHAQSTISNALRRSPFMAQDLAKATCFTISEELLHIIPQIDDYLCPICFALSYKPVRLRCGHVFCIRCLIVMQRAEQDHCPLCRGEVVLEATGGKSF